MNTNEIYIGQIVFIRLTEQYWDKPFTMKRHHTYDTRSVTLKCQVMDIKESQFRGRLFDNNGFEKDDDIYNVYVFDKSMLLSNQNFTDFKSLGVWNKK